MPSLHQPVSEDRGGRPKTALERPPYKRWRVTNPVTAVPVDCRAQRVAYQVARDFLDSGMPCAVLHWEDGQWRLFERIDPVTTDPDTEG